MHKKRVHETMSNAYGPRNTEILLIIGAASSEFDSWVLKALSGLTVPGYRCLF